MNTKLSCHVTPDELRRLAAKAVSADYGIPERDVVINVVEGPLHSPGPPAGTTLDRLADQIEAAVIAEGGEFSGTVTELLALLQKHAQDAHSTPDIAPVTVGRAVAVLRRKGVYTEQIRSRKKGRLERIWTIACQSR